MVLELYVDMLSQPCRALFLFIQMHKIPCKFVPIAIRKGEHKTEPYLKLNPLGKVPTLIDDDFILTESVAIFRYLAQKYPVPENMYPKDPQKRAKLDEYLEWQHLNTRLKAAKVFIGEVVLRGSGPINVEAAVSDMNVMLDELQMMFLKEKQFLLGDQVSFADILAVCELMQPTIGGRDVLAGRPKLEMWVKRVQRDTQPYFDDSHAVFYKSRANIAKKSRM